MVLGRVHLLIQVLSVWSLETSDVTIHSTHYVIGYTIHDRLYDTILSFIYPNKKHPFISEVSYYMN